MRFRNGIHYKVEPLKSYELDIPKEDVIYRLREQDGFCRNEDSCGYPLEFVCYKKGDFFVKDPGRVDRQVFLHGYLVAENDKTIVNVESVKIKGSFVYSIITNAICFMISFFLIIFLFLKGGFTGVVDLLKLLLALVLPILSMMIDFKEKNAIPADTEIMLNEIENRINGVIRWDN